MYNIQKRFNKKTIFQKKKQKYRNSNEKTN